MAQKATQDYDLIYSQYMKTLGGFRISGISETTREIIANTILANRDEGVSNIANAINEKMSPRFSRSRANTIARTETHTTSAFAIHAQAKNFEEPSMQKRWVSSTDLRTRASHRQASGQTVGIDDNFIVGGKEMQYAGDPAGGASEVINCRCVVVYLEDDDVIQDEQTAQTTRAEPVSPFGETAKDELIFQENADWNTKSDPYKAIKHYGKIKVLYGEKRAYADYGLIAVSARSNKYSDIKEHMANEDRKGTWRHEYGHVMDTDKSTEIRRLMQEKGIYFDIENDKLKGVDYISGFLVNDIFKDRKHQRKFTSEDVRKKVNKDTERFGLNGIKRNKKGKIEFVSPKDLKKSDYDMSTKAIINKEFKGSGLTFDDLNELADGELLERMKGGVIYRDIDGNSYYANQIKLKNMAIQLRNGDIKSFLTEMRTMRLFNYDMLYFADYLEAISNARIGFGHGKSYYGDFYRLGRAVTVGHTTEAMANYSALIGGKRAEIFKKLMKQFAPNMTKSFDEMFGYLASNDTDKLAEFLRRKADGN